MFRTNRIARSAVLAVLVYALLVLFFTLISLYVSPPESQLGKFRPVGAIPEHLLILAGFGVLLGLLSFLVYRRIDLRLAILIPTFVILLDLDHLPSALGISQPIRPAHSIIFLLIAFPAAFALARRLDLSFAMASGYFAHLGVDTGIFPPFSPFSFAYYATAEYRWVLLALAVASSLAAGYYAKRESRKSGPRLTEAPQQPSPTPMNQRFTRLIYYPDILWRSAS